MERKKIGYKCDLIIREFTADHEEGTKYGVNEVGIQYDKNGSKTMKEDFLKLPKALKDMLNRLVMKKKIHEGMEVVGFLRSDLAMKVIIADRPRPYVTRITRGKELSIPSSIEKFGAEVFPVLVQAPICTTGALMFN
ncbi:hypothetical protein G6F70_003951 [Rhizopus microsporus]|nr:hypothetical protein G6F71_003989 [Rhizopus microsporus]KAG1200544.1 hypothetical protein G6F70_003951 [Rhizopus microsporus]KAG1212917.1 hypothetical protein G6F69_003266 [Rhizopus microsporus]KAG1234281.1 hypothetical protein G6F67_003628 [Rhizopus microsporus]KAG1266534.1 hypothetical protein G6F68_002659 [Rhizopus microsporus]